MINNDMQNILLGSTSKYVIEEGHAEERNLLMALTVNRKLQEYGYSLDTYALRALSSQTAEEMAKTWKDMEKSVMHITGADSFKGELFYPNFPEEVMSKSDAELYINAMFYYTFSQSNDKVMDAIAEEIRNAVTEPKKDRLPLLENYPRELKMIHMGTEEDLFKLMDNRMHSLNMSEQQYNELVAFSKEYPKEFDVLLNNDKEFQSKETKVKLAMMLHESKRDDELKYLLKDSVDVLRFACYLTNKNGIEQNYIELKRLDDNKPVQFKLKTSEKKLVQRLLNNCNGLYTDIWKQEKAFKSLMRRLGVQEKDGCPKRVSKAFDNLANNKKLDEKGRPIYNANKMLPEAISYLNASGDPSRINKIAQDRPGDFLRGYINLVEKTDPKYRDHVIEAIKYCENSKSIPLRNMLVVANQLKIDQEAKGLSDAGTPIAKVYSFNKKKYVVENKGIALNDKEVEKMHKLLLETASKMVKGNQELGQVYIDPALADIKAPGREVRDASGGSTLTPYSGIQGDQNRNLLVFGCSWGAVDDNSHVDIDLSAHFLDADYNSVDHVSYTNLSTNGACHSGDYTFVGSSGKSTEAILIDKEMMRERGIRYIAAEVHCFSISSFKEAKNCQFVYEEKEGSVKGKNEYEISNRRYGSRETNDGRAVFLGEVFEPTQMEHCISLISNSGMTMPIVYDVQEDKILWLDMPTSVRRSPSVTENPLLRFGVAAEIERSRHIANPSMKEIAETFAQYNGEIVEDIHKADTIFTTRRDLDPEKEGLSPDVKIISSWDLDRFSAEFSGNMEVKEEVAKDTPADLAKDLLEFQSNIGINSQTTIDEVIKHIEDKNCQRIKDVLAHQLDKADTTEKKDLIQSLIDRVEVMTAPSAEERQIPVILKQLHAFQNEIGKDEKERQQSDFER